MSRTTDTEATRYDPGNDPKVYERESREIESPVGDDHEAGGRSAEYDHDEGGERRPKAEPEANPIHAGRNAIYAKRKEERKEEFGEEDAAQTLIWPAGMEPDKHDDEDQQQPVKRKLKVYGEERELTQDEIDALAQKQLASDTKFEDYKALEQRARAAEIELEVLRRAGPQARTEPEDEPEDTEAQTRAAEARAKRLEALNRIQMGDPEDALEALDSLLEDTRMSTEEISRLADERAEQAYERRQTAEQAERERRTALEDFTREYPEVAESRDLQLVVASRSHDGMVRRLKEIGVEEQYLAAARSDATLARTYYDDLRGQGYKLPEAIKVISEAAETVYGDFKIPRRARQQENREASRPSGTDRRERIAEKRTLVSEPSRAASQERNQPAKPQTREEAVAKMRAARGQAV